MIEDLDIIDLDIGFCNWIDVWQFNLMFFMQLGNIVGVEGKFYLWLEMVQGIFVNFFNVQKMIWQKLFFGIVQIGKVFWNEIVVCQFIFCMWEFEQMEM